MNSIYDYFSYHQFIEDWLHYQKERNGRFSQREFLRLSGISSSAVLHRVLQGNKIPEKYIHSFAMAMQLRDGEEDYFRLMIRYQDATTVRERGEAFSDLLRKRSAIPKYQIDDRALQFFKRWYYPVVREVISLLDGEEDYNRISRMVIPAITANQARHAVTFLEKNGFLVRKRKKLIPADPFFSTGARRESALLAAYHQKNLEINTEALDLVDKEFLSMSSLMMTMSDEMYGNVRKELADFRNRLMELARNDKKPADRVYHFNFTFLPRSRSVREKGK